MIDVHCHLTGDEYGEDIGEVIKNSNKGGVDIIICSGFDIESSVKSKEIAEKYENVYFTAGFQPEEVNKYKDGDMRILEELCMNEKCVAVGEIGLDYHFENNPEKDFQKEIFKLQLELAKKLSLPIVVHSRDACFDTLEILSEYKNEIEKNGGVMHCYSYSAEALKEFEKLGMYFSFGGTSTFKNAKKVKESLSVVRFDRILTETDSPYLSPEPKRGVFPNTPQNIPYIVKNISALRGVSEEETEKQILSNAKAIFKRIR